MYTDFFLTKVVFVVFHFKKQQIVIKREDQTSTRAQNSKATPYQFSGSDFFSSTTRELGVDKM